MRKEFKIDEKFILAFILSGFIADILYRFILLKNFATPYFPLVITNIVGMMIYTYVINKKALTKNFFVMMAITSFAMAYLTLTYIL